jgi:hypothetical protein
VMLKADAAGMRTCVGRRDEPRDRERHHNAGGQSGPRELGSDGSTASIDRSAIQAARRLQERDAGGSEEGAWSTNERSSRRIATALRKLNERTSHLSSRHGHLEEPEVAAARSGIILNRDPPYPAPCSRQPTSRGCRPMPRDWIERRTRSSVAWPRICWRVGSRELGVPWLRASVLRPSRSWFRRRRRISERPDV